VALTGEGPPRPTWARWWPVFGVAALMALVALRVVTWYRLGAPPGAHLTPRGEHLSNAGLIALPVMPVLVLVGLVVARRIRKGLVAALVGLAVLAGAGDVAFLYATFELFEPVHQRTVVSPDGEREAHLYVGGLLSCDARVYVSARRAAWGLEAASGNVPCETTPSVVFLEDGGVALGEPAP
jgi:hypothetical protein